MSRLRPVFLTAMVVTAVAISALSGGGRQPVEAATPPPVIATLYDAFAPRVNLFDPLFRPTAGLQVRADIPDLRSVCCDGLPTPLNENDRAIALTVSAPTAVALYSDIDFQGTCETFFGPNVLSLNGTIGVRSVSSVKVNATCLGPTTGKPIVTDLKVVTSPGLMGLPSCPSTYSRVEQDLNEGLTDAVTPQQGAQGRGGDHVYLCVQYGPTSSTSGVTAVSVIGPFDCATNCLDANFNSISKACPSPASPIMTDLNQGVHDFGFVYLCVTKSTGQKYLRDVSFQRSTAVGGPTLDACKGILRVPSGFSLPSGDANARGSNPLNIFLKVVEIDLCTSTYDGPDATPSAAPTAPPTLTVHAVNLPSNCGFVCVPQVLKSNDTVTAAGSVHVSWDCTNADGGGSISNHSPASVIVRNSQPWNITGTCVDNWGNVATATFSFIRAVP